MAQHGPLWDNFWNPWGASGSHLGVSWELSWCPLDPFPDASGTYMLPKVVRNAIWTPKVVFLTDFSQNPLGFCYSCTFLKGLLKSCFWILRQSHVFSDFYLGFVDRCSVSEGQATLTPHPKTCKSAPPCTAAALPPQTPPLHRQALSTELSACEAKASSMLSVIQINLFKYM